MHKTFTLFNFIGLAPLVLRGSCPQCTEQEKKQIKKVLAYVQVNFPKEWNKMLQTYASG